MGKINRNKKSEGIIPDRNGYYGITYWAVIYKHRIPRYEVFKYLGKGEQTNQLIFISRDNRNTWKISEKMFLQNIEIKALIPYLWDTKKMRKLAKDAAIFL